MPDIPVPAGSLAVTGLAPDVPIAAARETQELVEILRGDAALLRQTQELVEVYEGRAASLRETQELAEVLIHEPRVVRQTQGLVEIYQGRSAVIRETQELVEIFIRLAPPGQAGGGGFVLAGPDDRTFGATRGAGCIIFDACPMGTLEEECPPSTCISLCPSPEQEELG